MIELIGIVVALVTAGFCSGATVAIAELRERGVESLEDDEEKEAKADEIVAWWRARRQAVAMVVALGHRLGVVAAVVLTVSVAMQLAQLTPAAAIGVVVVATLLAVAIADVIPQALSNRNARRFGLVALRMLRFPYLLSFPVIRSLLALRNLVTNLMGTTESKAEAARDEDHRVLRQLVDGEDGSTTDRRRLLRSVVEFPATTVREIMVPRTDMITISEDMDLDDILVILLECGHSRIPVHAETLDDIVGLFYAKDLIQLMASGGDFDIENFLREPYFVPETKPISELLTEFQRERIHLAVVVDEFGGTEGLITLEDIIEEFFGDIQDEYDVEPSQLVELSATTVLADARIGIDEIEEHFDVELPQEGEYDSLGGFLLDQTGGVPEAGDEIECDKLIFRVMEADARRVDTVEIENGRHRADEAREMVS